MLSKRYKLLVLLFSLIWPAGVVYAGEAPGLISPTNTSTATSSKLEWNAATYALYSNKPYNILVDDNPNFSSPDKDYDTANTYYSPSLTEKTWYWKVRIRDQGAIWSDWSETWSFTLTSSTPTPSPAQTSLAVSTSSVFEISSLPSSINSDQSISVNVQITGITPNTKYYLKGAFFKKDSTNYFGYTKVSSDWVKNSTTYSSQYSFTTDSSGSFNTTLEVKPDSDDSGLSGSGSYQFKIGRYNSSGSGLTWSNEQSLNINVISSSTQSTAAKSPSPTPLKTPIPSSKIASNSATSNSKNTQSSIAHKLPSLTPDDKVKGESIENNPKIKSEKRTSLNWGFVAAGFIALSLGGGTFYVVKKDLLFKL